MIFTLHIKNIRTSSKSFIGPQTKARILFTLKNTSITVPNCSMASKKDLTLLIFIICFRERWSAWIDSIVTLRSSSEVALNCALSFGVSRDSKFFRALSNPVDDTGAGVGVGGILSHETCAGDLSLTLIWNDRVCQMKRRQVSSNRYFKQFRDAFFVHNLLLRIVLWLAMVWGYWEAPVRWKFAWRRLRIETGYG